MKTRYLSANKEPTITGTRTAVTNKIVPASAMRWLMFRVQHDAEACCTYANQAVTTCAPATAAKSERLNVLQRPGATITRLSWFRPTPMVRRVERYFGEVSRLAACPSAVCETVVRSCGTGQVGHRTWEAAKLGS